VKIREQSPDGETKFFELLVGVLQEDTLAPYLFVIVLDYVMCQTYSGRENELGFQLQKQRSRRNPAITITDLDFADDLIIDTRNTIITRGIIKLKLRK